MINKMQPFWWFLPPHLPNGKLLTFLFLEEWNFGAPTTFNLLLSEHWSS